ncbi:MAG TPA: hypothetical protein DDY31_06210 [Lachnospiraceae bacterium]|nr:hypothetical protein [Lachnospiraceae bacterium]
MCILHNFSGFTNTTNHQIYSDKFTLPVLNLTQIHQAAEEDKNYDLDNWARRIRCQCEAREDYKRTCLKAQIAELQSQLQNKGDTAWEKFL